MKRKLTENVSPKIYVMREQKVILDSDLAILYGVETKVILQAMRRNSERFPQDFVYMLSDQEVINLRSQIVTSSLPHGWGGRRGNYYAFTEHGVAMLCTVLKSERAVRVSIEIIRMFVKLRQILLSDDGLVKRVESLEEKADSHARAIMGIIRELEEVPGEIKQTIGFAVEEKA
jgi:hypothetical protein